MRKTKIQIIDETVEYYSKDPVGRRGMSANNGLAGACVYYDSKGGMCAVGRCLINPKDYEDEGGDVYQLIGDHGGNIDNLVKEEYRGHDMDFWENLQSLHDRDQNWSEMEISEKGISHANELRKEYKD